MRNIITLVIKIYVIIPILNYTCYKINLEQYDIQSKQMYKRIKIVQDKKEGVCL